MMSAKQRAHLDAIRTMRVKPLPPLPKQTSSWWAPLQPLSREAFREVHQQEAPRIMLHDRSKVVLKDLTQA